MAHHMTRVAYGAASLEDMRDWFATRGAEAFLTTRYLPRRHAEMAGGSLYWILKHHLVARSPILRFEEAEGGRTSIVIEPHLIEVRPLPRRAHQGWRYLDEAQTPPDLAEGESTEALPLSLASELARLGLV